MANARRYVFRCSRNAHSQLTVLFDFVHPAAIAMWNMRWQIGGYLASVPDAKSKDISDRFSSGSGIGGGSLKRTYVDRPWEEQQEMFAQLLLTNSISAFEHFTSELARLSGVPQRSQRTISKNLQFPGRSRTDAYRQLGPKIPALNAAFDWDNFVSMRYAPHEIDNLLKCYRFFKEQRNAIAHNGAFATQDTASAYADFSPVATKIALGVNEVPYHTAISSAGDPVKLSLRGVIGFTDILLRIIATYDVEFSEYRIAEAELRERFPTAIAGTWYRHTTDTKRRRQVAKKLDFDGTLPKVIPTPAFIQLLKDLGAIPSYA